jgi:hypothetical protein
MSTAISPLAVRAQLRKILLSEAFVRSRRMQRFLEFIVEETLAGRGDQLGEYCIGMAVFDRGADFEPALDPIVRVDARRLRVKLLEYYSHTRSALLGDVIIQMPKGGYTPAFLPAPSRDNERALLREVAPEVNFSHIVHGSVLKSGERYRVLISLIEVPEGRQIWMGEYEFEIGELVTTQSAIAADVGQELTRRLGLQRLQPNRLGVAA